MRKSNGNRLGQKLREARDDAGLTQRQVGDMLGLQALQVSRWERGAAKPDYARLEKVAELYGVPLTWFFEEAAA